MSSCRRIGNSPKILDYELVLDQYDDYIDDIILGTGGSDDLPFETIDCTGAILAWEISRSPNSAVLASFNIDWIDIEKGHAGLSLYCELPAGQTSQDIASQYFHHMHLTDSLGHRITIAKGICKVNPGVNPNAA